MTSCQNQIAASLSLGLVSDVGRAMFISLGLLTSSLVRGEEPFDVSLVRTHAVDLSPLYRRVVEEAAACYIGDFPVGGRFTISACPAPFGPHETIDDLLDPPFASVSLSGDQRTKEE